jgi:hypothetical protein
MQNIDSFNEAANLDDAYHNYVHTDRYDGMF